MAKNAGDATIDTLNVTIVVDGVPTGGFVVNVETVTDASFWSPGLNATFNSTSIAAEPDRVLLFTPEGKRAFAEKVVCPILTLVVVTPATASMEIGDSREFHATGYDQFGALIGTEPFVWSSTCGTATSLDDTRATFTAGTVSGPCTLTATSEGVSGDAAITIAPDPPVSVVVSPDPVGVPAGGTRAFTGTVYDQYGNVNATTPVSWATDAGSIDAAGVLTAQTTPQLGLSVTATTSGGLSDAAAVDVYAGPTDHVTITPASATTLFNGTQQFDATAYDAYNNANASTTITWSASAGSVTSDGLFTAPSTGGSVTVTATADGVDGTATVNVVREVHVDAMATYKDGVPASSFRKGADTVEVRTTVRDHESALVAGASVTVEFVDPDGLVQATRSGTTDANGVASTSYAPPNNAKQGTWTARVNTIAGTHLQYNAAVNVVGSVTFTVTAN